MTKIRLQSICLQNFKGTRYLLLNIDGKNTNIFGANGSGKTTVYHAYYWCLTGKTMEPNECVQTLDENNQIIHKIETSVTLTLMIDDSYEVRLQRKLVEKWKALGQPSEELKGTEQQRFFNDVPLSAKEFDAKLSTIYDLDRWFLLSDITKFMSLKTEERRKILMSIAGEVDEDKLMADYPLVLKAVREKKTVEELKKQSLSTKKRSNEELKSIPDQIAAQDRLKSSEDFGALRKEKEELDVKISDLDNQLKGSTEELQSVKGYNEKIREIEKRLNEYKQAWLKKSIQQEHELREETRKEYEAYTRLKETIASNVAKNKERIEKKARLNEEFQTKRSEWMKVNDSDFNIEELEVCPCCGHRFSEEEKQARKNTAVEEFNKNKSERLKVLVSEAEKINEQLTVLTGSINVYNKITKQEDEIALNAKESALNRLNEKIRALASSVIANDETYQGILEELNQARSNVPEYAPKNNQAAEEQKQIFIKRRDEVIRLLAGEEQNKRIDDEKERLEERAKELAQIVADCDNALYQIQEYRKAKVDAIEGKVNGFFKIARWKFFEKNISNDDLQEVCICHHNGVDYNSTNGADKINLGVDIISGLSKAMGVNGILFVDSKESCANLIENELQTITLEHVKDAPFSFNNF